MMTSEENLLSLSVNDSVGTIDVPPGGGAPAESAPTPAQSAFVPMHSKPGRTVTDADVEYVTEQAEKMHQLCFDPVGIYPSAHAIAHTQINDTEPLAFFVTVRGEVIVNPRIVNHTKTPVENLEGCMTCADKTPITVKRYNVIDLEFQTVMTNDEGKWVLTPVQTKGFSGKLAKIIQHETAHCLGHCIYEEGSNVDDCLDKTSAKV